MKENEPRDAIESLHLNINAAKDTPANTIKEILDSYLLYYFRPQISAGIMTEKEIKSFEEDIAEKLNKISPDKWVEPKMEIVGPAIENSRYFIRQEKLREMFSSLIASSANSELEQFVHPAFSEILKQMSVLGAKVMSEFKKEEKLALSLPICKYNLDIKEERGYKTIAENVFLLKDHNEDYDESVSASIENLRRLGLIHIDYSSFLTDESLYESFKSTKTYSFFRDNINEGCEKMAIYQRIDIQKGIFSPTPLGLNFIKTCL